MATPTIIPDSLLHIPAHLWVGSHNAVRTHIIAVLQKQLCLHGGCTTCVPCHAIATEQHYAVQWIRPEKQYTRELLDPLFERLSFALNTHERFFFILEQVDFMPTACANSLLKSLEEPPSGYYFFLCAQREHTILPTIRSRCMTHTVRTKKDQQYTHTLFDYFTTTTLYNPLAFLTDLEKSEIHEQESIALLDALYAHWMHTAKKALQEHNTTYYTQATTIIALLSAAFEKLPMPGSNKIFWKDIYVQIKSSAL